MKKLTLLLAAASLSLLSAQTIASESGKVVTMSELEYDTKLELALRDAQQKDYANAFPVLLQYAKYGDKLAQNIVGTYMLAGVGTQENIAEGLVWLGLAIEQKEQAWINHYESLTKNLPPEQKKQLEDQIEIYRAKYGYRAQFMGCRQEAKQLGSNLKTHRCRKMKDTERQVKVRIYEGSDT
jgi:TPR repeat protein